AGLGADVGVAWLDAHGDFHTPETTTSGFVDGMALAVAAGQCWRALAAAVPGFEPVLAGRVVHVGGRDFDPGKRDRLAGWGHGLWQCRSRSPGRQVRGGSTCTWTWTRSTRGSCWPTSTSRAAGSR